MKSGFKLEEIEGIVAYCDLSNRIQSESNKSTLRCFLKKINKLIHQFSVINKDKHRLYQQSSAFRNIAAPKNSITAKTIFIAITPQAYISGHLTQSSTD